MLPKYLMRRLFISILLIFCATQAVASARLGVGDPAPNFMAFTLEGKFVSLYQHYVGQKPVMLVFTATWCHTCLSKIPSLNQLHRELGDRFAILAINLEIRDSLEDVRAYQQEHGINYPIIFDQGSRMMSAYQVYGTPTHIIIATNGTILYRSARTPSVDEIQANWAALTATY